MKIVAVCGMGIGSSVLLKMNTDTALERLGLSGDVEAADLRAARSVAMDADLVLTNPEKVADFDGFPTPVRFIEDFADIDEIVAALSAAFGLRRGAHLSIAMFGGEPPLPEGETHVPDKLEEGCDHDPNTGLAGHRRPCCGHGADPGR